MKLDPRWAWEPYEPSEKYPWNLQRVGHLYHRATFGATYPQLQEGLKLGPKKLIDQLLKGGDAADFEKETTQMSVTLSKFQDSGTAPAWWIYRMMHTPHPLREKIALFWHNHFATSNAKVQDIGYMINQYQLMYRHSLGSFAEMLQGISKDPAMMIWLDTIQSKKGMPNENYARELMELFSLGIGNYTETDIREAARAFTGWEIRDRQFFNNNAQFDNTEKKLFGKAGKWKGEDIVKLCLEQKSCGRFIARKMFRYLVSETITPENDLIDPIAEKFTKTHDITALVETILRSNLFFSEHAYRSRIKAPVDFALGIARGLEATIGTTSLATEIQNLGQHLFHPPSVKGWDGGQTWLNGQTLIYRQNLALSLCQTRRKAKPEDAASAPLPELVVRKYGKKNESEIVDFFLATFLQGDIPEDSRKQILDYTDNKTRRYPSYWSEQAIAEHRVITLCHLVLTLPEFQLD